MKLLLCCRCGDVFQLRSMRRSCECGFVTGRYIDKENAVTNGNGVSLAIGNGSLHHAISLIDGLPESRSFYPIMAWARPNSGPSNPHTTVEVDE